MRLGFQLFDLGLERLDLGFDLLGLCVERCCFETGELLVQVLDLVVLWNTVVCQYF